MLRIEDRKTRDGQIEFVVLDGRRIMSRHAHSHHADAALEALQESRSWKSPPERLDAATLRARLATLCISASAFSTITGSNGRTVRRWVGDEQDIPLWVDLVLRLLEERGAPFTGQQP